MARVFDGLLSVYYGQAYVVSSESQDTSYIEDKFCGQVNGLCGAAESGILFLRTGLHTGDVGFTLDILDLSPPLDDVWEEIVEVSFSPGSGEVGLFECEGEYVCDIPLSQEVYRVRYCARNMDYGKEVGNVEDDPVDFYSLTFWPDDPTPDSVVKTTSQVAAYWHNWVKKLKL